MSEPQPSPLTKTKPRRRSSTLLGPLFHYDLIASTRRGQHAALRCLTAFALLIALFVNYSVHVRGFDPYEPFAPIPAMAPNEQANFANSFVASCLVVQVIGIFVIAPTVVADTIAREKENRTIEFLFVTELTDREIIFGKLGSRLAYLLGMLLSAMPILALTIVFGGVEIEYLVFGYVMLLSSLFVVGATSMYCSVTAGSVTAATVAAYIVALGYAFLCNCCLTGMLAQGISWSTSLIATAVNGTLGVIAVLASIHDLRPQARRMAPRHFAGFSERSVYADRRAQRITPLVSTRTLQPPSSVFERPDRPPLPPAFENRPLLWKEICRRGISAGQPATRKEVFALLLLPFFGALILFVLSYAAAPQAFDAFVEFSRGLVSVLSVGLAGLTGFFALRHATSSITIERERNTLSGLLTLPVERSEILEAKWLAGFLAWPLLLALVGTLFFGILTGGLTLERAFVLIAAITAPLEFLASLGLWLSIVSRNSLRANLAAILCLMLVAAGPIIVANYIEMAAPALGKYGSHIDDLIVVACMPPLAWVHSISGDANELRPILWGALGYAAGAWVLWRDACRRFRHLSH